MNHHSRFPSRLLARIFLIAPICLLAACANMSPANYPPMNTSIGETKEWRMPLNREPGQLRFKLLVPRHGTTQIALLTDEKLSKDPIQIRFSGYECSTGPEAHIEFYTSNTESRYKYFRVPSQWDHDVAVSISWDKNRLTSISVNNETITVQPHISFEAIQFSNNKNAIKVSELQYTPLSTAITAITEVAATATPATSSQGQ
ncbi:hypothetical protein [Undibacterium flavidum]|uniref:Lipoprotein n=1 Tax=Undibacterium flavidum TaxID=2762297 RepID=A0ABR6YG32_9BURK|nr:hypothetical protein [Undibacterium flavidum]MBC3875541.1 hypothetical protein [Undibacterium flavidum]